MSKRMGIEQDLSAIWERMVRAGQVRNRFAGVNGEQIESGMRMTADGPEQYALHVETGKDIFVGVMERPLGRYDLAIQWNRYRTLKPQAPGARRRRVFSPDVQDCLFFCQDPANSLSLLRRHIPFQMTLRNFQWAVMPNAVPVEKNGHFLWAPIVTHGAITAFPHWIQALTLPLLEDFLSLASSTTNAMTYFNSIHAGASVNHIHFQSIYRAEPMAIERSTTVFKNGRCFLNDYPASGLVYSHETPAEEIWPVIAKLQEQKIPYNLVHAGGRTFLVARNLEHEWVDEFPDAVLAGMEIAGKGITTEEAYFRGANPDMLPMALHKSTLREEELLRILES